MVEDFDVSTEGGPSLDEDILEGLDFSSSGSSSGSSFETSGEQFDFDGLSTDDLETGGEDAGSRSGGDDARDEEDTGGGFGDDEDTGGNVNPLLE